MSPAKIRVYSLVPHFFFGHEQILTLKKKNWKNVFGLVNFFLDAFLKFIDSLRRPFFYCWHWINAKSRPKSTLFAWTTFLNPKKIFLPKKKLKIISGQEIRNKLKKIKYAIFYGNSFRYFLKICFLTFCLNIFFLKYFLANNFLFGRWFFFPFFLSKLRFLVKF